MHALQQPLRRLPGTLAAVALTLVLAGCATEAQVKKIVADSNAELLASRLPDLQPTKAGAAAIDKDPAAQIEEFIAQHPDQPALHGALRVRQAVIFLTRQEYNRADAALKEAGRLGVFTDRDQALVAVRPHLIWWYENSREASPDPDRATAARKAFTAEAVKRQRSTDIRDYLAEGGAWIGFIELPVLRVRTPELKPVLEEIIKDYAFVLDAQDLAWLCKPVPAGEPSPTLQRRLRGEELLREAARVAQRLDEKGAAPAFTDPILQDLIVEPAGEAKCQRRFKPAR
jgi:outer membrane murein-binding lipoprotein Lpp